jgi:hypothetical protein
MLLEHITFKMAEAREVYNRFANDANTILGKVVAKSDTKVAVDEPHR